MFGCSLPVCSADYSCIQELVTPGINGRLFSTPEQLADHLMVRVLTDTSTAAWSAPGCCCTMSPLPL